MARIRPALALSLVACAAAFHCSRPLVLGKAAPVRALGLRHQVLQPPTAPASIRSGHAVRTTPPRMASLAARVIRNGLLVLIVAVAVAIAKRVKGGGGESTD